jgi:hypothetical protein
VESRGSKVTKQPNWNSWPLYSICGPSDGDRHSLTARGYNYRKITHGENDPRSFTTIHGQSSFINHRLCWIRNKEIKAEDIFNVRWSVYQNYMPISTCFAPTGLTMFINCELSPAISPTKSTWTSHDLRSGQCIYITNQWEQLAFFILRLCCLLHISMPMWSVLPLLM